MGIKYRKPVKASSICPRRLNFYVLQKTLKNVLEQFIRAPGMLKVIFWMLGNFMKTEKRFIILLCVIGILIKL